MCSDERRSRRIEMPSENNHHESVAEGNFVHFDEIGCEKEENEESRDLWSLCENNQDELVTEGNLMHFSKIGDEKEENEESGDLWRLSKNNRNELVKEGSFIHFLEIRDDEKQNQESEDLWRLSENNPNEFVKEGNFMHSGEFLDEEEQIDESRDMWSLCEPAKSHVESLLGRDGLSPISNPEPHGVRRNLFSNNSLRFCTESLGFESSDERDDCNAGFTENLGKFMEEKVEMPDDGSVAAEKRQYAPSHGHMGAKKGATFPPPLIWLKSSLLLKPLRKDGRFLLREVEEAESPAPRHEFLHTWRQDGRLRLQLIPHKNLDFIDTSVDEAQVNGTNDEPGLTSSMPSVDESSAPRSPERWGATWENERVEFPRADVSLPLFVVPLERCQENTTCLSTWNPRCITT